MTLGKKGHAHFFISSGDIRGKNQGKKWCIKGSNREKTRAEGESSAPTVNYSDYLSGWEGPDREGYGVSNKTYRERGEREEEKRVCGPPRSR